MTPSDESRPPPSGFGLGPAPVLDDRAEISPYDRVLLIVEPDLEVAQALLGAGRRHGFKGVVATSTVGLADAAKQLKPDAIVLDLHLPNQAGPATLEALKKQPETAQIPIHVLSDENRRLEGLRLGAQAHIQKPISAELVNDALERLSKMLEKRASSVLIVEDDAAQRHGLGELLSRSDVTVTAVPSAEEAIEKLAKESFDGMVLDLGLPGASGFELVERLSKSPDLKELPVVIYTSRELSRTEEMQLKSACAPSS